LRPSPQHKGLIVTLSTFTSQEGHCIRKENQDGSPNKFKAKVLAKGLHLSHGFDFHDTFSRVVTIHILLTLSLTHKWLLQLMTYDL